MSVNELTKLNFIVKLEIVKDVIKEILRQNLIETR